MNISPLATFWINFVVAVAINVANGTIVLTNAIPHDAIPHALAWAGIISSVGSLFMTGISATQLTKSNRILSAARVEGVQDIKLTPQLGKVVKSVVDANDNVNVEDKHAA